jgi:hypothetical protein
MFDYCVNDVNITRRVYDELLREVEEGFSH